MTNTDLTRAAFIAQLEAADLREARLNRSECGRKRERGPRTGYAHANNPHDMCSQPNSNRSPRAGKCVTYTPPPPLTAHELDIDAQRAAMGLGPMRDAPTTPQQHRSQRHLANRSDAHGIRTYTTD